MREGRTTHALGPASAAPGVLRILGEDAGAALVFAAEEARRRARWECGYMLYATLVQARALGVAYRAHLVTPEERTALAASGLAHALAALVLA